MSDTTDTAVVQACRGRHRQARQPGFFGRLAELLRLKRA